MMKKVLMGLLVLTVAGGCNKKETPRELAPVKVKTITVGHTVGLSEQNYSGTIEEESSSALSFAGVGTVESMLVSEGRFVRKGQLLGKLDSTAAHNAYEAARATLEQALDARERLRMLRDSGSLPEIKWIEIETQVRQAQASEQIALKSLHDTRLVAPFSGYISKKDVESGANVVPGIAALKLVRIDQVKVKINVPEEDIGHIMKGQTMQVSVAAIGKNYEARVTEKGVSADPFSRSYEVKGVIANPHHELLPGMVADVKCMAAEPTGAEAEPITVPAHIVQIDADNRPFVWTVTEKGRARCTCVILGENRGQRVVVEGLSEGQKVISEGWQKVSTGMEVTE